jgi:hypothetical protein
MFAPITANTHMAWALQDLGRATHHGDGRAVHLEDLSKEVGASHRNDGRHDSSVEESPATMSDHCYDRCGRCTFARDTAAQEYWQESADHPKATSRRKAPPICPF